MTASIRQVGLAARTGFVLVVVAAVLAGLAGPNAAPRASAESSGLEVLGELDLGCPAGEGTPGETTVVIAGIDPDARRLYTRPSCDTGTRIIVHDLSTEIPTVVQVGPPIDSEVGWWNTNRIIVSQEAGRMFVLGNQGTGDAALEVYDLETLERVDLWLASQKTPGFYPVGFAHDPDRDRFYLLGEMGHRATHATLDVFQTRGNPPQAAVVAIEDTSGEPIWVDHLDGCETPLNDVFQGGVLKMSAVEPRLYGFCVGAAQGGSNTGQGGLVRLDVSQQDDIVGPEQAGAPALVDFRSDFFPVSGDYTSEGGVAGLDPVRERFFAHSLSAQTHGAWVFDGQRSSWIGFVAADDDTNKFFGLDPVTGKHYMAGEGSPAEGGGWINVTDGGATPVPQGRLFEQIRSPAPWTRDQENAPSIATNVAVDPQTGRLFTSYTTKGGGSRGSLVLRDTTSAIIPRTALDLDELTHDLPDVEARLEFSAYTSGFGAQYVKIGGWENVWTRPGTIYPGSFGAGPSAIDSNPAQIRYGGRGATMSLVEQIGIAESGSSASAIATRPDENTPADAQTKQNEAEGQANEATDGGVDDLSNAVDVASSDDEEVQQARYVTCLDGNGERIENDDPEDVEDAPAYAKVVCDLENMNTTGFARFSGGSGGGGVVVSDSSFDGRTYRDPDRGIVTETGAIAEGIFFGEADLGGFSIDRVTSTVTTSAKGLDGTAHVKWVRTVEGMRTIGDDGTASEPTSCTTIVESGKDIVEEGRCESLQKDLNELMPNRFEVRFPLPEVVATPGGAFASVQETETDYLSGLATNNDEREFVPGMEITVFADGPQRGRLWVQLAAVKADATFIRHEIVAFEPFGEPGAETTSGGFGTTDGSSGEESASTGSGWEFAGPDLSAGPIPPGDAPPTDAPEVFEGVPVSHAETLVGAFGWLPALRSAGDAALTGALYVLFMLPVAEVVRRRRLLDVLSDAPADEARQAVSKASVPLSMSPVSSPS